MEEKQIVTLLVVDEDIVDDPQQRHPCPGTVLVGRTPGDVVGQFREKYADLIEDWAWMGDEELLERCSYEASIKTRIEFHSLLL